MPETNNTSFLGSLSMPESSSDTPTMIKVDHVTMVFNIASEQLNSLKEYAIALSRRELRFKEFRALDDVSFEVKQGDVFGILGTNGSGKSTMLKIIAGVLEPTRGTCEVNGSIAPLIELGAGFDMELTARENIFLNGALLGYSKKFIQQNFDEIVDFAEVRDFLDMPMKNYSSGMVARIAFAIATVIVPEVLIVDEVLSVGDFMFQQKCERRIQSLIKEHGVTVLIVSHNNDQIERLCNKAVWIEKGHLRAIGSAQEVCELYRAIGGRPGSAESEKTILGLLEEKDHRGQISCECVYGDDHFGTAVKMNEFVDAPFETVILTNCYAERENRIATGLAGALNASILTVDSERIPDITAQEIKHRMPNRIIAIGNEEQIDNNSLDMLLDDIAESVKFDRIECDLSPTGIEAWKFAISLGASWGETAVIVEQNCESIAVSLSPYLFSSRAPIFYLDNDENNRVDILDLLKHFKRLIVIGKLPEYLQSYLDNIIEIIEFENQNAQDNNDKIVQWLEKERVNNGIDPFKTIAITSPDSNLDNLLAGPFAGRLDSLLIFQNPQDLDSMSHAFSLAKERASHIERVVFMGSELRYSFLNKKLMARAVS